MKRGSYKLDFSRKVAHRLLAIATLFGSLFLSTSAHSENRMNLGFSCTGVTSCDNNVEALPPTKPGKKKKFTLEIQKSNGSDTGEGTTELLSSGFMKFGVSSSSATGRLTSAATYNRNNREGLSLDSFLIFRSFFSDSYFNVLSSSSSCKDTPTSPQNYNWVIFRGRSPQSISNKIYANDTAYKFAGVVSVTSATPNIFDGTGAIDLNTLSLDSSSYYYSSVPDTSCSVNTQKIAADSSYQPLGVGASLYWGDNSFVAISRGANPNVALGIPQTNLSSQYLAELAGNSFSGMMYYQSAVNSATFKTLLISPNSTGTQFNIQELSDFSNTSTATSWGSLTCSDLNSPAQGFCKGTLTKNGQTGNALCAFGTMSSQGVMACTAQLPSNKAMPIYFFGTYPARAALAVAAPTIQGLSNAETCSNVTITNGSGKVATNFSLGTLPSGVSLGPNAYDGQNGRCGTKIEAFQSCTVPVCVTMADTDTREIATVYHENDQATSTVETTLAFNKAPVPVINVNINTASGVSPLNVTFSASATVGNIETWVYDFGDASSDSTSLPEVTHTFQTGTYSASVYGIDSFGQQSNTVSFTITSFIDSDLDGIPLSDDCSDHYYDPTNSCSGNVKNGNNYVWYGGSYYAYFSTSLSWAQAKQACMDGGGHLATVSSQNENNAIWGISNTDAWIGLTDRNTEGSFRWITGESVNFTNWGWPQPDNAGGMEHYVHVNATWGWNDHVMNGWGSGFPYICEYFDGQTDTEPTPSTPAITSVTYDYTTNTLTINGTALNELNMYYFDFYNQNTGYYDYFYTWDASCGGSDTQWTCNRYFGGGTWSLRYYDSSWSWKDNGITFTSSRPGPVITSISQLNQWGDFVINGTNLDNYNYVSVNNWWTAWCWSASSTEIQCGSPGPGCYTMYFYNYYGESSSGDYCWYPPSPTINSSTYDTSSGVLTINGSNLDNFYYLYLNDSNWNYAGGWYYWDCGASISSTQVTCTINLTTPGHYYAYFRDQWWYDYFFEFDIVENITGNVLLLQMEGDNNGTTFTDSSPRNLTVSRGGNNAITSTSQIRFGASSGYFDGASWLKVTDNNALHLSDVDFTIEGWFHPSTNHDATVLWTHRNYGAGYGGALLYADSSGLLHYVVANADASGWQTSGDPSTGLSWSLNQWQHIALVRTGNTLTAYLNGVAGTPITITGAIGSSGDFAFLNGAAYENIGQAFEGYADEFKITRGTAVYTANFTPPQLPVNSKTVLLMHMDGANNSTTFTDDSDYNFTVTPINNARVSTTKSKIGGASARFDGSSELKIDSNSAFNFGTGDFTVEGWINLSSQGNDLFMISGGSTGGFFFGYHSQRNVGIGRKGINWDFEAPVSYGTNQWNHIAVSRSGSTVRLFFNGLLVGSQENTQSYDLSAGGTYIGSHGGSYHLNGNIDELRVTRGKALYTASFAPPITGFISQDSFTGDGIFDEFCYDNFVSLGAVGGGTGYCAGDNTFYIGGVPYPGLDSTGTGASGTQYFVNGLPGNGYINNVCYDNSFNTFGVVGGSGWCSGDSIYYLGGAPTLLDSMGNGNYNGQYYLGGVIANRVVADNTVLLLHMDGANNSTTFTDSSSSALTATLFGNAKITTSESKFGGASAYFDGNGDYVSFASSSNFNFESEDYTLELWFKPATGTPDWGRQWQPLITTADPTDYQGPFLASYYNHQIGFLVGKGNNWNYTYSGNYTVTMNWQHVAVSRKGNTYRVFHNGTLMNTFVDTTMLSNSNNLIRIGGRGIASQVFHGYIDEVRVTKGKALYTASFTPPSSAFSSSSNKYVCYSNGVATTDLNSSGTGTCSGDGKYYVNGEKADGTYNGILYADGVPGNQVVKDNTVLLLHMDGTNNSTTFTDSSGLSHSPTSNGPVISTAQSKFGGASAFFSGSGNQYLAIPSHGDFGFGSGDFTIDFWARPTGISSFNTLINVNNYQNGILFRHGWNTDSVYLAYQSQNWSPSSNLPSNQWTHVALVRNLGIVTVFINGSSVLSWNRGVDLGSSASVMIGASAHNTYETFVGYIDELRIAKGKALYLANFTPSSSPHTTKTTCYLNGLATNDLNSSNTGICSGDNKYYVNGEKAQGTYNGFYYIDGSKANGIVRGYRAEVMAKNPLAYWRLGDTAGTTATDSSGYGFNGTYSGGYTLNQSGAMSVDSNPSAQFNGTNAVVNTPLNPEIDLGQTVTLSTWVNPTAEGNYRGIGGGHMGSYRGIVLFQSQNGVWGTGYGNGSSWVTGASNTLPLNTWSHIAAVFKGSSYIKVYINGALVSNVPQTTDIAHHSSFWIGKAFESSDRFFQGKIDEFAVFSYELSAAEIAAQYKARNYLGASCFVNGVANNDLDSSGTGTCSGDGITYVNGIAQ